MGLLSTRLQGLSPRCTQRSALELPHRRGRGRVCDPPLGGNDGNVLFFGCHCSHCHNNSVVTRTVGPVGQVCFAKRYTVTGTHRIKKVLVGLTHGYWLPVGCSCSRTCQDEPYRRLLMAIRRRCWRTKVSMEVEVVGIFVVAFLDKILVMEMKGFLAVSG